MTFELSNLLDLERYPLDDQASPARLAAVETARDAPQNVERSAVRTTQPRRRRVRLQVRLRVGGFVEPDRALRRHITGQAGDGRSQVGNVGAGHRRQKGNGLNPPRLHRPEKRTGFERRVCQ